MLTDKAKTILFAPGLPNNQKLLDLLEEFCTAIDALEQRTDSLRPTNTHFDEEGNLKGNY